MGPVPSIHLGIGPCMHLQRSWACLNTDEHFIFDNSVQVRFTQGQPSRFIAMDTKYDHLEGLSEDFRKSCNVLVQTDDGVNLPVHTQILAKHSKVCAAMLADGLLSAASVQQKAVLPLTECSTATAIRLLRVLYSNEPIKYIPQNSSMAIASLAHKLDMQVVSGQTPEGV